VRWRSKIKEPLISAEQRSQLLANGLKTQNGDDQDHLPVIKLFTPDSNATWVLTEIDLQDEDIAFGPGSAGHIANAARQAVRLVKDQQRRATIERSSQ